MEGEDWLDVFGCLKTWGGMALEDDGSRGLVGYGWECMTVWDEMAERED